MSVMLLLGFCLYDIRWGRFDTVPYGRWLILAFLFV
jgi:hypothetical protein